MLSTFFFQLEFSRQILARMRSHICTFTLSIDPYLVMRDKAEELQPWTTQQFRITRCWDLAVERNNGGRVWEKENLRDSCWR